MLDFLDEVSSNSSSEFMFEVTYDVNTDFEYDELAAANRTSPSPSFYDDMNDKYCLSMFPTNYHTIAYIGMSILFSMLIFIGNILVLILPYISKTLRSPIFTTLLSFAVVSLFHGFDMLFSSLSKCSLLFSFRLNSAFVCMLFSCGRGFIANIRSLHLNLLACQRIYVFIFPLKARVHHTKTNVRRCILCIYIACVLIEIIMGVQGVRDCAVSRFNHDWYTTLKTHADFIVINLMVVCLLSAAMVSGIVQKYASSRLTKSASQKSQSRIASIVIILYFTLYCPLQIVVIVLQFTCKGQNYLGPISFTISTAHFVLSALNPIMLCLRVPEAKKALKDRLCRCINK